MVLLVPSGACGEQAPFGLMMRSGEGSAIRLSILPPTLPHYKPSRVGATVAGIAHSHIDRGLPRTEGESGTNAGYENRQDAVRNPARKKPYRRTEMRGKPANPGGPRFASRPPKSKNLFTIYRGIVPSVIV